MLYVDLGLIEYGEAHQLQKELRDKRVSGKLVQDICLIAEHPPVFTLGRRGVKQHIQVSEAFLQEQNVSLVQTERGGEVTYHGPGQLVFYPIVNLHKAKYTVTQYVNVLEELMCRVAAKYGVTVARDVRNAGVWAGDRKVGSIGIALRKGVTYHGLALNVSLDLTPFSWVSPCGLTGVSMSSLENELGAPLNLSQVKDAMIVILSELLGSAQELVALENVLSKEVSE